MKKPGHGARAPGRSDCRLEDDFLATLSHELRTRLHVIQSWIWQLNRTEQPAAPKKALEVIERNVALQSRLVEDLLDVSRASNGRLQLNTRLVDLASACLSVVEVLRLSARAKNIQLEVPVIAQTAQPASLDNDRQLFSPFCRSPATPRISSRH